MRHSQAILLALYAGSDSVVAMDAIGVVVVVVRGARALSAFLCVTCRLSDTLSSDLDRKCRQNVWPLESESGD